MAISRFAVRCAPVAHAPTQPAPSRREFLVRSATGAVTFVSPAILTSRNAYGAQSQISPSVISNVFSATLGVYNTGYADPNAFGSFSSAVLNLQSNLSSLGLDSYFSSRIPGFSAPSFSDSSLPSLVISSAQMLGFTVPSGFATFEPLAQPTAPQVQTVNSAALFNCLHANANHWAMIGAQVASASPAAIGHSPLQRCYPCSGGQGGGTVHYTKDQAVVAAAAGGVFASAGVGLIVASGVAGASGTGLVGATVLGATLFSGGAALLVIGLGVAGFVAWNYLTTNQPATPPVSTAAVNAAVDTSVW